ncbi:hypothetical protein FRACA_10080 [Frankia canadensis]|uniref:Uncharacterized protein n=1 Tax=Frankia canadensis TaxID=1836972 RepID=A0A2I2KI27_9ACTN|nr:hypothetical protein FRACA_10080 [Frankia canadensis]SOU52611.1 hypothetical protein FRACA_10080 [Frankia canadensis]
MSMDRVRGRALELGLARRGVCGMRGI